MVLKDRLLDLVARSGSTTWETVDIEGILSSTMEDPNPLTVEDLRYFTDNFYPTHPALAAHWLGSCGWRMLDQVISLSMLWRLSDEDIGRIQQLFPLLARHTNARELYIVIIEKFSDALLTSSAFIILCGALLQSILHTPISKDLVYMVEMGCCRSVIRTLRHVIRRDRKSRKSNDGHACKAVDQLLSMSWSLIGHVVHRRRVHSGIFADDPFDSAETYVVVAFLLHLAGKCVVLLSDRCVRRPLFLRILAQLTTVLDGDLKHLFREIYLCRQQSFEADRECALQRHRGSHSSNLHIADDMREPLNRVSQAPYSALLTHYFDAFDFREEAYSTARVHWVTCVSWHSMTSELQQQRAGKREDGLVLRWELGSIALMAHSFLQHLTSRSEESSNNSKDGEGSPVPLIYRADYWKAYLYPYVLQLFGSRGVSASLDDIRKHEGLEFSICLLLDCHSIGNRPLFLPLFMPALLSSANSQAPGSSMSHILLSFYRGLPATAGISDRNDHKFWTALDAAKLAFLSATASDILFMCQSMITAMSACDDTQLRSQSFAALRSFLKCMEERSLFGLLRVLISSCPFPNIAGAINSCHQYSFPLNDGMLLLKACWST